MYTYKDERDDESQERHEAKGKVGFSSLAAALGDQVFPIKDPIMAGWTALINSLFWSAS